MSFRKDNILTLSLTLLSAPLSLTHTHAHTHTHALTQTHTHTHKHTGSPRLHPSLVSPGFVYKGVASFDGSLALCRFVRVQARHVPLMKESGNAVSIASQLLQTPAVAGYCRLLQ